MVDHRLEIRGIQDLARSGDLAAADMLERLMVRQQLERPPGYPWHLVEEARAQADRSRLAAPPEDVEQRALVTRLELATLRGHLDRRDWWHTPNGGGRGKATAGRLKAEGVFAGVADLIVALPVVVDGARYDGVCIELKRARKGRSRVSAEQEAWLVRRRTLGWIAEVCWGADEAWALLTLIYGWRL